LLDTVRSKDVFLNAMPDASEAGVSQLVWQEIQYRPCER
jgi:hypothetical protein